MIVELTLAGAILLGLFVAPAKGVYTMGALAKARSRQPQRETMEVGGVVCEVVVDDFMDENGVPHTKFWVATMAGGQRVVLTNKEVRAMTSCDQAAGKELMEEICQRKSRQVVVR